MRVSPIFLAVLSSLTVAHATQTRASILLASFEFPNMGGFGPCEIAPVDFFLGVDGPPPSYCIPVGRGLALWNDGESGAYDITKANEPSLPVLATLLTNGQDDTLMLLSRIVGGGGDGGTEGTESRFFPGGRDLAGNRLDFVRLYVSNVQIWTIDESLAWRGWCADVTYEFWGEPIPEPATGLSMLLAVLLCRRRRARPAN
jgi:hypothetical protein